jgi:hypothetical protein
MVIAQAARGQWPVSRVGPVQGGWTGRCVMAVKEEEH